MMMMKKRKKKFKSISIWMGIVFNKGIVCPVLRKHHCFRRVDHSRQ